MLYRHQGAVERDHRRHDSWWMTEPALSSFGPLLGWGFQCLPGRRPQRWEAMILLIIQRNIWEITGSLSTFRWLTLVLVPLGHLWGVEFCACEINVKLKISWVNPAEKNWYFFFKKHVLGDFLYFRVQRALRSCLQWSPALPALGRLRWEDHRVPANALHSKSCL